MITNGAGHTVPNKALVEETISKDQRFSLFILLKMLRCAPHSIKCWKENDVEIKWELGSNYVGVCDGYMNEMNYSLNIELEELKVIAITKKSSLRFLRFDVT